MRAKHEKVNKKIGGKGNYLKNQMEPLMWFWEQFFEFVKTPF
jgi:hypothetical protein